MHLPHLFHFETTRVTFLNMFCFPILSRFGSKKLSICNTSKIKQRLQQWRGKQPHQRVPLSWKVTSKPASTQGGGVSVHGTKHAPPTFVLELPGGIMFILSRTPGPFSFGSKRKPPLIQFKGENVGWLCVGMSLWTLPSAILGRNRAKFCLEKCGVKLCKKGGWREMQSLALQFLRQLCVSSFPSFKVLLGLFIGPWWSLWLT